MVAYSFQKEFVARVEDHTKLQTLRNERERHAKPGEEMQLYYAQRTKHCRLLGRPTCRLQLPIRLMFGKKPSVTIQGYDSATSATELDHFAFQDGFDYWYQLCHFWSNFHPEAYDAGAWSGVLIGWRWA